MIELRTLGELSISDGGRHVRLGTRKQYALLVYLASHRGRVLRREQLAALLWEQAPISKARHSLSQTLYDLRRRLHGFTIGLQGEDVWIEDTEVAVDALEFQALIAQARYAHAVTLYSGPFLEGFWISGATAWDAWQEGKRAELDRLARHSLLFLLNEAEATGDWLQTERLSCRLLDFDPYDETVHRIRIRAIAASGDHVRAITEYRILQETIDRELGRALHPDTITLRSNLASPPGVFDNVQQTLLEEDSQIPFVGRRDEFLLLRNEWNATRRGEGRVVAVLGEAGIGKTRFCHRVLRWTVLQGARILQGHCYSSERQLPYSGMVDALVNNITARDIAALSPNWSSVIRQLLPELFAEPDNTLVASLDGEGARRRLFEGIAQLIANMAQQSPVVLFIDDFHWADDSTAAMTHYLARRLRALPVLLLLAVRPEDVATGSTVDKVMSRSQNASSFRSVTLFELDSPGIAELIRSYELHVDATIPSTAHALIQTKVGGRPFLIIEMLNAWRQGELDVEPGGIVPPEAAYSAFLPSSLEAFLTGRFRNLSESAITIAHSLAVLGKQASPGLIHTVSSLPPAALLQGIGELTRKGIITESGHDIAFAHDLLREAAYRSLDGLQRRILHERAATILGTMSDAAAGMLAVHYDRAGNQAMAFQHGINAAQASERLFAQRETEFFLRLALNNALTPQQTLVAQERMADFLYSSFRYREAGLYFDVLASHYETVGNTRGVLLAQVNRAAIDIEQNTLGVDVIIPSLHEIAQSAERMADMEALSDVLRRLAIVGHYAGNREVSLAVVTRLLNVADALGHTRHGILARAMAAAIVGIYRSAQEGLKYADVAVKQAETTGDPFVTSSALRSRAKNRMQMGLLDEAEADIAVASHLATQIGFLGGVQDARLALAFSLTERGEFERSRAALTAVMQVAEETQSTREWSSAAGNLLLVYLEQEQLEDAEVTAKRVLSLSGTHVGLWSDVTALSTLGLCALSRNDMIEAKDYHGQVAAAYADRNFVGFEGVDVSYIEMFLARYAAIEGEVDTALERLDRAIVAYQDRDVFCRSRLQLERARLLMDRDPRAAWLQAGEVRSRAVEMGARPLVVKADAILDRLPGLNG